MNNKRQLHVIIPAAGLGTRMRPLSNGLSKTLISLNGRPILDWIIESIKKIKADILDVTIVTNNSGDISRFIETTYKGTDIYNKIKCVVQNKNYNGPGGAILSAVNSLEKNGSYLIWLGDTVCRYTNKKDFEYGKNIFVATATVDIDTASRWCVAIKENDNTVFYNKPNIDELLSFQETKEQSEDQAKDDSSNAHDNDNHETDEINENSVTQKTIEALIGIYYIPSYNASLDISYSLYQNRSDEIEISELLNNHVNIANKVLNNKIGIDIVNIGNTWYDCGELDSYYKSKARLLNLLCRAQSGLYVNPSLGTVRKFGNTEDSCKKLKDEYSWFTRCEGVQKLFIPKIIGPDAYGYTMELSPGNTLSDMLVYENIPINVLKNILTNIIDIYHKYFVKYDKPYNLDNLCVNISKAYNEYVNDFYINRSSSRLLTHNSFYQSLGVKSDFQTCLNYITKFADNIKQQVIPANNSTNESIPKNIVYYYKSYCCTHGDFHLGNILFDSLTGKITFLDPRGESQMSLTDTYYDMAKLYHDLYCGYMLIIRELYTIENDRLEFSEYYQNIMKSLVDHFDEYLKTKYGYNPELIKQLATIQILTCIPFHKDDTKRCKALLMRAMNIINSSS